MNRTFAQAVGALLVGIFIGFALAKLYPAHRYVHLGGEEMYDEYSGRFCSGQKHAANNTSQFEHGTPTSQHPDNVFDQALKQPSQATDNALPYCGEE